MRLSVIARSPQADEAIAASVAAKKAGLLRGACHRARIRATRWLAMTVDRARLVLNPRLRMLHVTLHSHRAPILAKAKQTLKWQRDPEGMRIRILEAAKQEFAAHGLAGARVDRIAAKAGANKRMLYYHVGKKDDLYLAVLEGAYEKIRAEERGLDLEHLDPPQAIERLIDFTWNYFISESGIPRAAQHREPREGPAPEALHKSQIDAFAVRRDDPHRGEARHRERRFCRRGRSGAALHLDRGAVLLLSLELRRR